MPEFVTVAIGNKNIAGDWIVRERADVQAFDTGFTQIVITPPLDGKPGYNLTHVQSGFYMLGPFPNLTAAREAAVRLAKLFPVEDWNIIGQMSRSWVRPQVKKMFRRLSQEDQQWMRQNGANL